MRSRAAQPLESAPARALSRRVEYFWMIMGKCNYRCPYCVYGLAEHDRRKDDRFFSAEEWLAGWRRMHERYGEGNIILTGGEPTLFPGFADLVAELSSMFRIGFDTNLSWDQETLAAFLRRVSPERVRIEISYHPSCAEIEPFLEKARLIRDAGFESINRLVAYPPLLPRLAEFRALFARAGLTFVVNPFQGVHEGRHYPESYTEEQKRLVAAASAGVESAGRDAPHGEFVRQILDRESPKGRLCRSGSRHVRVEDDGRVYRCGEYSTRNWERLGDFFDENLRLWDEPRLCRSGCCEWEYRWLVDQAERFQNA